MQVLAPQTASGFRGVLVAAQKEPHSEAGTFSLRIIHRCMGEYKIDLSTRFEANLTHGLLDGLA